MACNRRVLSGEPLPEPKRRKKHSTQPRLINIQPKPAQKFNGDSMRVALELFGAPPYGSAFENSVPSFPSQQSTHPSTGSGERNSSLTSGPTTRLECERGLSINTPSTPTSSSDGYFGEYFGNTVQIEQRSPSNAEFTLCGINDNSCKSEQWPDRRVVDLLLTAGR